MANQDNKKNGSELLLNIKLRTIEYIKHLDWGTAQAKKTIPITQLYLTKGEYGNTGFKIDNDHLCVVDELEKCAKILQCINIINHNGKSIDDIALALKHLVHIKDKEEVQEFADHISK